MKYFALTLGVLLSLAQEVLAQTTIEDIDFSLNPDKTVTDAMIEVYRNHPEILPEIEEKCKDLEKWAKGAFDEMPSYSFVLTECITWEINKKLNEEQIELLAKLDKVWSDIIIDQTMTDGILSSFNTTFDYSNEYSLQLAVRIYNLVMKEKWPECLFETDEKNRDTALFTEPCNQQSKVFKLCEKVQNSQKCMQEEILKRVSKFIIITSPQLTKEQIKTKRIADIKSLMKLTEDIILQLVEGEQEQNKEIVRLYNFYWLSILRSHKSALNYIKSNS
ncbi:MAG: hypothetical protein IKN71_01305 [Alphaproteobacteria bacterium]|nr:hypothetical protein [Alphaproteobacteria bacterium]